MASLGHNDLTHLPLRVWIEFYIIVFMLILVIDGWDISWEIALRWMPLNLADHKSKSIQVMAWCHQATSHYLSQCWPVLCCHMAASLGHNKLMTTTRRNQIYNVSWNCLVFKKYLYDILGKQNRTFQTLAILINSKVIGTTYIICCRWVKPQKFWHK